jgi:hypothetical protein
MLLTNGAFTSVLSMPAQAKPIAAVAVCNPQAWQDREPRLSWEGVLGGRTLISVRGWTVDVHGPTPDTVGRYRYHMSLPLSDSRDQDVMLIVHRGRQIRVIQQPRKENQHTAIIQIDARTPTYVSFELLYWLYPHSWFDAPTGWWDPRDVVHWEDRGNGRITLICGEQSCRATHQDSGSAPIERFDFALRLPTRDSVVELTDVQMPGVISLLKRPDSVMNLTDGPLPAAIIVVEQPSRSDNYKVRISVNLPSISDYSFTMTWSLPHVGQ